MPTIAFGANDPSERAVVQRVLWLRRSGYVLRDIAAVINEEGFRNRRGGAFQHNQIARMLRRSHTALAYLHSQP